VARQHKFVLIRGRSAGATFAREWVLSKKIRELLTEVSDDLGAKRDWRAADHAREGRASADADFDLRIVQHAGDTVEESELAVTRHEEEVAEVDGLDVDHDAEALVPGGCGAADADESVDEGAFLAGPVGDVAEVTEDGVGEGLEVGIFFDVHHVEEWLEEGGWEEGEVFRAAEGAEGVFEPG